LSFHESGVASTHVDHRTNPLLGVDRKYTVDAEMNERNWVLWWQFYFGSISSFDVQDQ
jgi:hypothetical protein